MSNVFTGRHGKVPSAVPFRDICVQRSPTTFITNYHIFNFFDMRESRFSIAKNLICHKKKDE